MKRKVIRQGHNTLTITLPAKWVESNNIKAGDEIEIEENEKKYLRLFSSVLNNGSTKSVEIDVSGLDHNSIRQKLRSAYKFGYDEITILFDNNIVSELRTEKKTPLMELINHEVSNLIGCEVIKQSNNSCVIKDYAVDSELEFDSTLRRIFLLVEDFGQSLIEQMKNCDSASLEGMRERHFNIAKFIFYCLRLINKGKSINGNKETFLYYIVTELDEILDIMKYAAADFLKFKGKRLSKDTLDLLTKMIAQNKFFCEFFYKPTAENLGRLAENRWNIKNNIFKIINKTSTNELWILKDMAFILELYYHLTEARVSLDYKSKYCE